MRFRLITVFGSALSAVLLQGCQERLEQQMDASILDAAQIGTGCVAGDRRINVSEDVGPSGFNPKQSADQYAIGSLEYSRCAKVGSDPARRERFSLLSAIASDMAAVRFAAAGEDDFAFGASLEAKSQITQAERFVQYASKSDQLLMGNAARLIQIPPEKQ